jgi:predicted HicB family RNase H-like nuclease
MATMPRALRIPDEVWQAALTKARAEGTTLTAVVVEFLRKYAAR